MKFHYSLIFVLIYGLYTNSLVEMLIFFICIFLHELGHILFIIIFKQKILKLTLTIYGGQLEFKNNLKGIKNLLINIGGIFVNILIIMIASNINNYHYVIIQYNLILIIFNLLPIYPLDGYRILISIIEMITSYSNTFNIISFISIISIMILLIISILLQSIGLLFITIILLFKNVNRINNKDSFVLKKIIEQFT